MTPKILSLEEIEKIEQRVEYADYDTWMGGFTEAIEALLATARAYHEVMEKLKKNIPTLRQWLNEDRKATPFVQSHNIAQWLEVPMEFKAYMSNADEQKIIDAVSEMMKPKDKPHPATIKVIIEALEAGTEFEGDIDDDRLVFNPIKTKKHLESILKEL